MLAQTLPEPRSPELASAALWTEAQETEATDMTPDPTLAEATPKAAEVKADTASDIQAAEADTLDEELLCLALNIYHEARSEPLSGQIAVARVTLNRVASKSFPSSICGVVRQGGEKLHHCQFSWWCDGKPDHPTEPEAWRRALEISQRVLADEVSDPTHGALYYHADYVRPSWSHHYQCTSHIGRHLFYRPSRTSSAS